MLAIPCRRTVSPGSPRSRRALSVARDGGQSTSHKVGDNRLELCWVAREIHLVPGRHVDHRAEPRPRQKHAILVADELLLGRISLGAPVRAVFTAVVKITREPAVTSVVRN